MVIGLPIKRYCIHPSYSFYRKQLYTSIVLEPRLIPMQFTVFYDGGCPLCMAEMRQLMKRNTQQKLVFVDIHHPNFCNDFSELDRAALDAKIHGRWSNGKMLSGLDVTYTAWKQVGRGWIYAPLRWPIIRIFADYAYVFFARHRHRISYLLTGKNRCQNNSCKVDS